MRGTENKLMVSRKLFRSPLKRSCRTQGKREWVSNCTLTNMYLAFSLRFYENLLSRFS